jgi:aminoglycoside phosphotransferase (APT) family kinase protein
VHDDAVRAAIRDLGAVDMVDAGSATAAWDHVVDLPQWQGAPVWVHSDLLPGNLLARRGRLSAVIDFGCVGVGDPACDVMVAWTVLSGHSRGLFRESADIDDTTWARGRGWALAWGLMAEHHYRATNPALASVGRRAVSEALADCGLGA